MLLPLPAEDLDLVVEHSCDFWSQFSGSRIFITGGTGFLGLWLVSALQRANDQLGTKFEIEVLTRDAGRARTRAPHVFSRPDTSLIVGDVAKDSPSVGQFDICIHAATDVAAPKSVLDHIALFDSIVFGTRKAIDLSLKTNASKFLLVSSGAVYGQQPPNLRSLSEDFFGMGLPLVPSSAYASGKRAAEWMAASAGALGIQMGVSIARVFAVVGPGMPLNGNFAAGNFIRDALAGDAITISGDGTPLRTYMYSADLCIWLLKIIAAGANGSAYNVGSEVQISLHELAQKVAIATAPSPKVRVEKTAAIGEPRLRYVPDSTKAKRELHVREYTSLDTALEKTIRWNKAVLSV